MPSGIQAKPPDLTTVDLSTLDTTYNYNLGPTGMRGWMLSDSQTALGMITAGSWQILVVGVGSGTPAAGIMANNDVILGVSTGAGTPVPLFTYSATNDIRKSQSLSQGRSDAKWDKGRRKMVVALNRSDDAK